jgi:metallophosphoesterase (TIGR00282 family)
MNILYLGDIMGDPGIRILESKLSSLKNEFSVDIVAAQSENVSSGKGIGKEDFNRLRNIGVDFFTGGNWSLYLPETESLLTDPEQPIIRPANYPIGTKGAEYKYVNTKFGKILFISLLGQIVGRDADTPVDNPLKKIDEILDHEAKFGQAITIVNFHGDFSSEKLVIGQYLDGRVSAVIGDHWHIATADAMVLPNGTAHITDVGMCGSLDSSLGIKTPLVIDRWKNQKIVKNELEEKGRMQINAVLININDKTKLSDGIKQIIRIY